MHIGDRYGQLFQMSYITRDMDAAIAHARDQLGITGFRRSESTIEVMSFGQKRTLSVKAAMADIGANQFEIIQPVAGATEIYTDEVDLGGHILNFHHVAIAVEGGYDNWARLLDDVRASGDEFAFLFPAEPDPQAKVCFCYVDTRQRIGHYTEYLWMDPALAGAAPAS
ncbi:VOC family protein [Novosphingobium album (ex Liu et al. 2023)]|uniref:VOC family protein n=1 Tax=Novosphingobium album (ex Liu et al. 2023) TaxID=3031130 RepID=A0ABT5WM34_9SPHN|nr:VOC family protein [Novosphingobium album (ex Liu et al. 2023)]MDE8651108.1 VOC family protein [Novosphingobium album (ex Liu et al. 2023)]